MADFVRVTGLFRSDKKPKFGKAMFVGTARPEDVKALAKKVKQALTEGKGITFFLFQAKSSDDPNTPAFTLTADVAQERQPRKARRPIEDEDDSFETERDDEIDL